MSYAEELIKLRKRVTDAVGHGIIDSNLRDFYEGTLIQIMNEAERQRQHCVKQAEDLRRQAAVLEGQAQAFSQQSSIVYSVLNGFIIQAEKVAYQEAQAKEEREKNEAEQTDEEKENLRKIEAKQSEPKSRKRR